MKVLERSWKGVGVAALLVCLVATGAVLVSLWTHPDASDVVRQGILLGLLFFYLFVAAIFSASYLFERRTVWQVSSEGLVATRSGRVKQFLAWDEVRLIDFRPFGIRIWTERGLVGLYYLSRASHQCVKEYWERHGKDRAH